MGAPPTTDGTLHSAGPSDGVWLTDREPGELLGTRRVVVYVGDSPPIVIAEVESRREAEEIAEHLVELVDLAATGEQWIELGDRLVRPGAIESIDVELAE
jgi:hypothetical protein